MKKNIKTLVLILVIAALSFTAALGIFADDDTYTGTVEELTALASKVTEAGANQSKLTEALKAVGEYLNDTPVDPDEEGYSDVMATVYKGVVDCINATVTASASKSAAADKSALLFAIPEIENLIEVPDGTEGYSEARKALGDEAFACAELYLDLMAETEVESTARNAIALNNINALLKKLPIDSTRDGYAEFEAEYNAKVALHRAAVEENKQKMLDSASLSDYFNYVTIMDQDFTEDGLSSKDAKNNTTQFTVYGNPGTNFISSRDGIFTVTYGGTGTNGNTYAQKSFPEQSGANATSGKGIVIDFDITTLSRFPESGFSIEGGGTDPIGELPPSYNVQSNGKTVVYPKYFVLKNGNLYANDDKTVLLSGVVTAGEWLHITCIYNPIDFTFSLYCEYEHLGTYPANYYWNGSYTTMTYVLYSARFNARSTDNAEWSIDNVQIYQGTSLRDLSFFDMTDDEAFSYYTDYLLDESKNIGDRNFAYHQAEELLEKYWSWTDKDNGVGDYLTDDETVRAMVDAYLGFVDNSFGDFERQLRLHYRDSFVALVDELAKCKRGSDEASINERDIKLADIVSLLSEAGANIEKDEAFSNANSLYSQLQRELAVDKSIVEFSFNVGRLDLVESLFGYEKYYNRATECLANVDLELLTAPGYEKFASDYEKYLNVMVLIENMQREANSKKIVACYDLISIYPEEEWIENYEYMNAYVEMIRATIAEGYYSPSYPRTSDVIREFKYMDSYFYEVLQQMHIDELTARLEFIASSDAYIDKMGACAYITRYIESNDIDRSNATLSLLISRYESVVAELELREEDYEAVLQQNAYYFINLVEKMRIADGYLAKKVIYDEAQNYAFALNATVEGVDEALRIYDEHTLVFESAQKAADGLLAGVAILMSDETDTADEKFAALVDCYGYSLEADVAIEGVAEALEVYEAQRAAFDAEAAANNAVISTSGAVMGSVRANCGVKSVVAVIVKKLFE